MQINQFIYANSAGIIFSLFTAYGFWWGASGQNSCAPVQSMESPTCRRYARSIQCTKLHAHTLTAAVKFALGDNYCPSTYTLMNTLGIINKLGEFVTFANFHHSVRIVIELSELMIHARATFAWRIIKTMNMQSSWYLKFSHSLSVFRNYCVSSGFIVTLCSIHSGSHLPLSDICAIFTFHFRLYPTYK